MDFALTTRWNASRHSSGEAMIEEILALGFTRVELGYDLRRDLVPGVKTLQAQGAVRVDSVHNFCPVPMGVTRGHPELWTFCSLDTAVHEQAVQHTARTVQFAAEMGAKVVVTHCGYVSLKKSHTRDLIELVQLRRRPSAAYEKAWMHLVREREKRVGKHLQQLYRAMERLLPVCEQHQVQLALENLPSYEAVPNELEMEALLRDFPSPFLKVWHDLGHAQIRENLGFINHERWLERLRPALAGFHVHDVASDVIDHVMPPAGDKGLERFRDVAQDAILRVLEPSGRATGEEITGALVYLNRVWAGVSA